MKNITFIIICVILCFTNAFADESQTPTRPVTLPQAVIQQPADNPDANITQQDINAKKPDIPESMIQENNKEKLEQPRNIPPVSVTPNQIKAFLSKPKEDNYIILNFDNADLKDVINTIGSITNENFILSPGVDARITIHSAKKIPVSEVMSVFESVLEANGISIVRSGSFLKIVPGAAAKQKPLEVRTGDQAGSGPDVDRPVTQIVPVQFVPVTEVSTVLTPMLSQFGSIIPNPRNNLLIINDLSSNILRLMKVLQEIDVNAFKNTRMSFFKPEYSDVLSLSNELTEVLNALNLGREGVVLVPIERINSLIIFSASPTLLETVEGWLRKLDEEVVTGQNIFIYPVQNIKAEKIAEILKSLYEASDGTTSKVSAQKAPATAQKKTTTTAAPAPVTKAASGQGQASGGNSRVEIITFEPTNSLVILAPAGIYREIVKTIKKIDVYPREVLIEAVIAEVTITDSDQYGIQWSVLHDIHQSNKLDITGLAQARSENMPTFSIPPSLDPVSLTASGLSYLAYRPDKFTALIHALASKGKVNILSSPRLLVRDQEEASIEVGEDVPTASSTTSTTTTETLTQAIEYRTVGIKLKIKPTINDEKTVVLDLEQEVSSKGADQQVGREGTKFPSFNSTKTKTSIVLPDKQGIVIGGIMEEKKEKNHSGIPLLKDIPLLGYLFRYNSNSVTKKELVIIITPHVITNKSEGEQLSSQFIGKLKEIKTFLNEENINGQVPPQSKNQ